ncbi:MAG: hypothetical protein DRP56_02785 [Planctomycetota bacterium]|nr:MAG: hypothetical protein DRP56_02785 [Planctomycetota bacterium]
MTDFGDVRVYTGREMQASPAAHQASTALANIEQSRAVAEVQASIVLAKANPRNEEHSYMSIMKSCKRKSLAECASYSYRRGSTLVTGPSIRLAEVVARCWGNINYGFREIGRGKDYSEVEAFAHDLETNTKVTRQFQVRHWRDTRSGGKDLNSERDKYELVASMAQRRVRACLLELIPGDIVEAAEEACKATLMDGIGNMDDQAKKIVTAFSEFNVTAEMIEGHLQRSLKSLVPADVVNLKRIYRSIRDGVATVDDFFTKSEQGPAGNENVSPRKEKEPEKPARVRSRPKVVEGFKGEIDVIENSLHLDRWRQKHFKRMVRELPSEKDQKVILGYAEQRYQMLKKAEQEKKNHGSQTAGDQDGIVVCPNGNGNVPLDYCETECSTRKGCPAHDDRGSSSKLTMEV